MAGSPSIRKPTRRECERCGRREAWQEGSESWTIDADAIGDPHCIHEWDINGTFLPYE